MLNLWKVKTILSKIFYNISNHSFGSGANPEASWKLFTSGMRCAQTALSALQYRPEFPERFGCIEDTRSFCKNFFHWYNAEHYRSGIGFLTPEGVRFGRAPQIIKERQAVLNAVFLKHPDRFKGGMPKPTVWPFPHLSGSTNRRFPKAIRWCTKFLPDVSLFHWQVPAI